MKHDLTVRRAEYPSWTPLALLPGADTGYTGPRIYRLHPPVVTHRQGILVVDEDPCLREVIARRFRAEGYSVHEASTCSEATAISEAEPIDSVILSLALVGRTGIDLLDALRGQFPNLPLLALAKIEDVARDERAFNAGADDVLSVPIDPTELVDRVRSHLRRPASQAATIYHMPGQRRLDRQPSH